MGDGRNSWHKKKELGVMDLKLLCFLIHKYTTKE